MWLLPNELKNKLVRVDYISIQQSELQPSVEALFFILKARK